MSVEIIEITVQTGTRENIRINRGRDGVTLIFKFQCPLCDTWTRISSSAFEGREPFACGNPICSYSEYINFRTKLGG